MAEFEYCRVAEGDQLARIMHGECGGAAAPPFRTPRGPSGSEGRSGIARSAIAATCARSEFSVNNPGYVGLEFSALWHLLMHICIRRV